RAGKGGRGGGARGGRNRGGGAYRWFLLGDRGGDLARRPRKPGGEGGIAAKTDDRRWLLACEQAQALNGADAKHRRRARQRQRVAAAHGCAGDDVNVPRRECLAVALGAIVGRKRDGDATPAKRLRERFGRKQVSAGPAGGHENKRHAVCSPPAIKN